MARWESYRVALGPTKRAPCFKKGLPEPAAFRYPTESQRGRCGGTSAEAGWRELGCARVAEPRTGPIYGGRRMVRSAAESAGFTLRDGDGALGSGPRRGPHRWRSLPAFHGSDRGGDGKWGDLKK